jgi:peptidoglycan/xylan/chitin deacetylase (PgdA/CDA1 family)
MKLYWVKTRWFIKRFFSGYVWDIPNNNKTVYLTFDDGPTPEVTEWVLVQLRNYNCKAVFFCIGNNIDKYPEIFQKVINEGHTIGNHTYNHVNGWNTENTAYLENIEACERSIINRTGSNIVKLFRPPYGKIKKQQAKTVREKGYKIIMWDVLSADFDTTITPEQCLHNVIDNVTEGSVIIFHDSVKAFSNLEYTLPKVLEYLKENGFSFGTIN